MIVPWSNGTTPGPHPGNDGSPPSGITCPGTPTAERRGLNPRVCRFDSCSGHIGKHWLGRQQADHLDSDSGMLWVQIPPEPLTRQFVLAEQWSARLPVKQEIVSSNPIGDAEIARYANWKSGQTQNLVNLRVRLPPELLAITCVGWALASSSGCNPPVLGLCRFNSCPTHWKYGAVRCWHLQRVFQARVHGFDFRVTFNNGPFV